MIKISALNEDVEEESDSEEEITKEALEQIALQQYAKGLELQRNGKTKEAMQLMRDLLETELLDEVRKPAPGEKTTDQLFNLKYLCYKNVAAMQSSIGEIEAAIDSYCAAAELDDTDVTLWHRLGLLCYNSQRYEMALDAFQRGIERNPRHWPCLDKIVTLFLGLSFYEDCIITIHDAFVLDPDYLRGIVYRKHIYTTLPYVQRFMEFTDPKYKWIEKDDGPIDEDMAEKLLKEAQQINEVFIEQQKAQEFKHERPELKLKKPISKLSWVAVGESLVNMHQFMADNCFSHACPIEVVFEKEIPQEPMEICEEVKKVDSVEVKSDETNTDTEKNPENGSENENNDLSDKDKGATDTEKIESDVEMVASEAAPQQTENKEQKKGPGRRRGSDLSYLQQWDWCKKRRSGRKKQVAKDTASDNIYDILRRMVPIGLIPEIVEKKENQARQTSPDPTGIDKLFEEKLDKEEDTKEITYFGSENEEKDVENFIEKYKDNKCDMIDILKDYLKILSVKWASKWPESLPNIFVEANKCYNTHIEVPECMDENHQDLIHFVKVNLMAEELTIDEYLKPTSEDEKSHDLSVVENVGHILQSLPHIFDTDSLQLMLRYLWTKMHIHLSNKNDEFSLNCLYQLVEEFEAMGEEHLTFSLLVPNFTFKPAVNENEIFSYIKFLERNKRLSIVTELYEAQNYDEVLSIVIDSFEHCKDMARKQEDDMSLDFAIQLSLILDSYWALGKVDECVKWSFTCLHEALKHFFRFTSGCPDYEKWNVAVVKVLCSMEHILSTEGLMCLEAVSQKELSQGLEDLIRIIGHQVETTSSDMPFDTVIPWIIMHYILQREEDQGRGKNLNDNDKEEDEVPSPLLVLFLGHEQLGNKGWCMNNDGKLLYFILDNLVPQLRSPLLSKSLEQILQQMEQCVFCLFGHPVKKHKIKYLEDHNVSPHTLDWPRAQQIYEVFRPLKLPELEGKVTAITVDTEQLFQKIITIMPPEYEVQKYVPEVEKFISGKESKLPTMATPLPFKMKDIYFLLGDYYFKKEEGRLAIKYNMFDIVVNNNRFESWAQVTLAKGVNLEAILNSCNNINNEKDFLKPANTIIRCFEHTLKLASNCDIWIEYGNFVYAVHSFCSRLLKQASESLSMEDFESLEKQKEEMLNTTQKSFTTITQELKTHNDTDKLHEGMWLAHYILGKVAEKRGKHPSEYIDSYWNSVKSLHEAEATYPAKINYNSPQHYAFEVLELHYRIHASILKYIEQHENKPIPASIGKVFLSCIEQWNNGPFSKKAKKPATSDITTESEPKPPETEGSTFTTQAANILKRSISDAGEDHETTEAKKLKLEAAAKVRRSASYDTERKTTALPNEEKEKNQNKLEEPNAPVKEISVIPEVEPKPIEEKIVDQPIPPSVQPPENTDKPVEVIQNGSETQPQAAPTESSEVPKNDKKEASSSETSSSSSSDSSSSETSSESSSDSSRDSDSSKSSNDNRALSEDEIMTIISACIEALEDCVSRFPLHYKALYRLAHYHFYYKKGKDIERCRDIMLTNFISKVGSKLGGLFSERKSTNFFNNIWRIPVTEIDRPGGFANHMNRCILLTMEILKEIDDHKTLLDLSLQLHRIPELDKKYLRDSDREELTQQAFSLCVQSLKGQLLKFGQQTDLKINEVEKKAFNSLMLDIYRAYQRAQKTPHSKHFTNLLVEGYKLVTTVPITENMNLVDISMKYCQSMIQQLKQQATQASLDKNQNAQKKQTIKTFDAPKTTIATTSTTQSKPEPAKPPAPGPATAPPALPKMTQQEMAAAFQSYVPMLNDPMLSQQAAAAMSLSYLSSLSALAGYSALSNSLQSSLQSSLQNSFQAEFYRQFIGQSLAQYNLPPAKKQKRASNKQPSTKPTSSLTQIPTSAPLVPTQKSSTSSSSVIQPQMKGLTKSHSTSILPSLSKSMSISNAVSSIIKSPSIPSASISHALAKTTSILSSQKTTATFTPSMGTVLSTLPASLTAQLTPGYSQTTNPPRSQSAVTVQPAHVANPSRSSSYTTTQMSRSQSSLPTQAHINSTTVTASIHAKPPKPHQQTSPGKTLQEKLAERQKNLPIMSKSVNPTSKDINASLGRLPSSVTVMKSASVPNKTVSTATTTKSVSHRLPQKKVDVKKALPFNDKPKPISSDEVIVLDDDSG